MDIEEHNRRYRAYKTRWQKQWRKNNPEIQKDIQKKHNTTYKKKNPLRILARKIVYVEKRAGRLKPLPCVVCGNIKVEAHHPDHRKPLKVIWLCRSHHMEMEKKVIHS